MTTDFGVVFIMGGIFGMLVLIGPAILEMWYRNRRERCPFCGRKERP